MLLNADDAYLAQLRREIDVPAWAAMGYAEPTEGIRSAGGLFRVHVNDLPEGTIAVVHITHVEKGPLQDRRLPAGHRLRRGRPTQLHATMDALMQTELLSQEGVSPHDRLGRVRFLLHRQARGLSPLQGDRLRDALALCTRPARIREKVGAIQVPIVERDDGRWMSDSTPMILQLEREHPERPVLPPIQSSASSPALIEDYADEWLWRAAMHYRWSYEHDRALLSRILVDEIAGHLRLPRTLEAAHDQPAAAHRLRAERRRAPGNPGPRGGGLSGGTGRHDVPCCSSGAYLLGNAPSLADFGLMGPMLRHFGQDPTPAEIMRNEARRVRLVVPGLERARQTAPEPVFLDQGA